MGQEGSQWCRYRTRNGMQPLWRPLWRQIVPPKLKLQAAHLWLCAALVRLQAVSVGLACTRHPSHLRLRARGYIRQPLYNPHAPRPTSHACPASYEPLRRAVPSLLLCIPCHSRLATVPCWWFARVPLQTRCWRTRSQQPLTIRTAPSTKLVVFPDTLHDSPLPCMCRFGARE